MTFLDAPSGYGKTALLREWARSRGKNVRMVNASRVDANALGIADVLRTVGLEGFLVDRPNAVVVVDHAHALRPRETVDVIADLLSALHPSQRIIFSGQMGPCLQLQLAALVPHPLIISGSELALTSQETYEFANRWGHELSINEADELYRIVGGWPALTQHLLEAPRFEGGFDLAHACAALRRMTENHPNERDVGELLQRLAMFDEFTWADVLAAASFQETPVNDPLDAVQLFARLRSLGRVVPVAQLATLPAALIVRWRLCAAERVAAYEALSVASPAKAKRLASFLGAHLWASNPDDRVGETLRLARLSGGGELLSQIWARHALTLAVEAPETLESAYGDLPPEIYGEYPLLGIAKLALDVLHYPDEKDRHGHFYRQLEVAQLLQADTSKLSTAEEVIAILTSAMSALRASGEHAEAVAVGARVSHELEQRQASGCRPPTLLSKSWWLFQWAQSLLHTGCEAAAESMSARALETGARAGSDIARACAAAQLSMIRVRSGIIQGDRRDRDGAQEVLRYEGRERWLDILVNLPVYIFDSWRAIDRLDRDNGSSLVARVWAEGANTEYRLFAAEVQAYFLLTFGKPHEAWDKILALRLPSAGRDVDTLSSRVTDRLRADTFLALGELNRAKRVLDDVAARVQGETVEYDEIDIPWLRVARARLRLIAGDPRRARECAEASIWRADVGARDRIELLLIQAAASLSLRDSDHAHKSFTHARRMMEAGSITRPYRTIPDSALRELWGPAPLPAQVACARPIYPETAPLVELTKRERMVVLRLANHASAPEIAREFVVSPNTVRKQIASVYDKLDVHDRASMIETANRLGLI